MKTAFLFAGQGAQSVGMGRDLYENYAASRKVFEKANEALGFDICKMIFEGDEETLKITENTQPAILTMSVAALAAAREHGLTADVTAGLSLGEYTAHVASGSLEFEDAVKLVRQRGKLMQEEVPVGVGTMAAILNLSSDDVRKVCDKASEKGVVEPANFNCPGQITVAGEIAAVEYACELAKEEGARRAMLLPVSAPFHCSMLKGAGEKLSKLLEDVQIHKMQIPIITNVTGDYIKSEVDIKSYLIKQVSSSVLFEDTLKRMLADGVDTFIEIGPGKTLSGFVKKINAEVKTLNIDNKESLENTLNETIS